MKTPINQPPSPERLARDEGRVDKAKMLLERAVTEAQSSSHHALAQSLSEALLSFGSAYKYKASIPREDLINLRAQAFGIIESLPDPARVQALKASFEEEMERLPYRKELYAASTALKDTSLEEGDRLHEAYRRFPFAWGEFYETRFSKEPKAVSRFFEYLDEVNASVPEFSDIRPLFREVYALYATFTMSPKASEAGQQEGLKHIVQGLLGELYAIPRGKIKNQSGAKVGFMTGVGGRNVQELGRFRVFQKQEWKDRLQKLQSEIRRLNA